MGLRAFVGLEFRVEGIGLRDGDLYRLWGVPVEIFD